jgi:hypothetical protein
MPSPQSSSNTLAFLFDLDGTLVDSVYQDVLAWRDALEDAGLPLAVWRIHRRIGMSGGLFVSALAHETGRTLNHDEIQRIQELHADAFRRYSPQVRPLPGARELLALSGGGCRATRHCDERISGEHRTINENVACGAERSCDHAGSSCSCEARP